MVTHALTNWKTARIKSTPFLSLLEHTAYDKNDDPYVY